MKEMYKFSSIKQKSKLLSLFSLESIGLRHGTLRHCLTSTTQNACTFVIFAYFFVSIKKSLKGIQIDVIKGNLQVMNFIEIKILLFLKSMGQIQRSTVKI